MIYVLIPFSTPYPLFDSTTVQGGVGALAAPVPWLQNAVQGGLQSAFYRFSLKSTPGAPFLVVPIPL